MSVVGTNSGKWDIHAWNIIQPKLAMEDKGLLQFAMFLVGELFLKKERKGKFY